MAHFLGQAICLHCSAPLPAPAADASQCTCAACGHHYPLLDGEIPLLLENPDLYAANLLLQYDRYLREQEREQERWTALPPATGRAQYLPALLAARRHNNALVEDIRAALLRQVPGQALLQAVGQGEFMRYATNWSYLRRDWCGLPDDEAEVAAIYDAVVGAGAFEAGQQVLVAGAATARLAWLLRPLVSHVYALDISLTMAWQFRQLRRDGELRFYDIQTKNLRTVADAAVAYTARLTPTAAAGNFSYFVADARRVPLADHSLDAIVAVYFTDTLPLRQLLPEVRRLLKPGGRYVHFGPLEYHFDDAADMLSAEEVRQAFEHQQFEFVQESEVPTRHVHKPRSLAYPTYRNWCFTAVARPPAPLLPQTVLALAQPLAYQLRGTLAVGGEETSHTTLLGPGGTTYEGADTVLDVLRLVDGQRTGQAVIAELARHYELDEATDTPALWAVLRTLYQDGVLRSAPPASAACSS